MSKLTQEEAQNLVVANQLVNGLIEITAVARTGMQLNAEQIDQMPNLLNLASFLQRNILAGLTEAPLDPSPQESPDEGPDEQTDDGSDLAEEGEVV